METKPNSAARALGKLGGKAIVEKYGVKEMQKRAKAGGDFLKRKYGSEYFRKIRQIGIEKAKKRAQDEANKSNT